MPFLGYYLFGYLLREGVRSPRVVALSWAGLIFSIAVLAGGTGVLVHHYVIAAGGTQIDGPPSMDMLLYDFLSPARVLMALCAWVVLLQLLHTPTPFMQRHRKLLRAWADTTLGLYLIHPAFREIWYLGLQTLGGRRLLPHGIDATWPNVWIGVPLVAVMVYVPALVATSILLRIPYLRRIAG